MLDLLSLFQVLMVLCLLLFLVDKLNRTVVTSVSMLGCRYLNCVFLMWLDKTSTLELAPREFLGSETVLTSLLTWLNSVSWFSCLGCFVKSRRCPLAAISVVNNSNAVGLPLYS